MTEPMQQLNGRLTGPDGTPGAGLKVTEAVILAGSWWDKTGRGAAWRRFNEEQIGRKVRGGGKAGPLLVTQGDMQQVVPSGILRGERFHDLKKAEKLQVVKVWYAEIWLPQQRADKPKPLDPHAGKPGKTEKGKRGG